MDLSPRGLVKNWLPQLPALLQTAILHPIGKSQNAEHQEWLTEILVQAAKPILQTPAALLASQEFFKFDPGVRGRMWVSKYTIPSPHPFDTPPSDRQDTKHEALGVDEAVAFAIKTLANDNPEASGLIPPFDSKGLETEWHSYRPHARRWTRLPKLSQQQLYQRAVEDLHAGEDSPVLLHAHGGAFCLMDPANHRSSTALLAQHTDSRVISVRYRLSPQNIFPAALMDMFLAYLALIAPPPGAFHKAVPAEKIVLVGDSSGGNLVTALQTLLTTLVQHEKSEIANPWSTPSMPLEAILIPSRPTACLSLASPWLDITRAMPSCTHNARYDLIAPAPVLHESLVSTSPLFPADSIWPSNPPRAETYCEAHMCAHPLVTPLLTPLEPLKDFPNVYANVGWEGMSDETEILLRRLDQAKRNTTTSGQESTEPSSLQRENNDSGYASSDNVDSRQDAEAQPLLSAAEHIEPSMSTSTPGHEICFDGYTAQPHTFAFIPFNKVGWKATYRRTKHIRRSVGLPESHGKIVISRLSQSTTIEKAGETMRRATWTNSKTMHEIQLPFEELGMHTGKSAHCGYEREEPLTDELVQRSVRSGRDFRVRLEKRLRTEAAAQGEEDERQIQGIVQQDGRSSMDFGAIFHLAAMLQAFMWFVVLRGRDVAFLLFNWILWQIMRRGGQM